MEIDMITIHHLETHISAIHKMSGIGRKYLFSVKGKKKLFKKIHKRKKRRLANNPNYYEKI